MKNNIRLFSVSLKLKKTNLIKINQLFSYQVKIIKQDHDFFYLRILEKDLQIINDANIEYQFISYKGIKHLYQIYVDSFKYCHWYYSFFY